MSDDGTSKMATLAIEILDAASGKMAEDVQVQVSKNVRDAWQELADAQTNSNGSATLCEDADIKDGGYFEVMVHLGSYFEQTGQDLPQYKMVDIVPLRFGIDSASSNITLRMSVTPHSYTADFATEIRRINLV